MCELAASPMPCGSAPFLHQQDVDEFLRNRPAVSARLRDALTSLGCLQMEAKEDDQTTYWRGVVEHFVRNNNHADVADDEAFYVVDAGVVISQMAKFAKCLPMVQPYYAVKCNPSLGLLRLLSALGVHFDCASGAELRLVLENNLAASGDIIFANPCKTIPDLRVAQRFGVRHVTFDNVDEIDKLVTHMSSSKALLRIRTNDASASTPLSSKFGARLEEVPALLQHAASLGLQVVGCSFHVGTDNHNPDEYVRAILDARRVFDMGVRLGFEMKVLDVGGGFPGFKCPTRGVKAVRSFEDICDTIRPLLEREFKGVRIIAEPGRFFTTDAYALAMNVHSMRTVSFSPDVTEYQYYCNDGIYQTFNNIVFDHAHPEIHLLRPDSEARVHQTTLWGPTCDSLDCIMKSRPFPELSIGDWLFVPNMGSYTLAAATSFNGFTIRRTEYVCSLVMDSLEANHSAGDSATDT